jgi:glycosyltransferase involved in cell wall biosynthesis
MGRSLYICYFGVQQPLVQTQVIPYLRELTKGGHELDLLTFEPGGPAGWESRVRQELLSGGITWHRLRYHKRPSVPATLFDVGNGARYIRKLASEKSFDILHCRSHVPMMMAAFATKGMRDRPKLLFDIRGFFPEEYVDAGIWPEGGSIYRSVKRVENWLMKEADGFVLLTEKARGLLAGDIGQRPVEVIPCCVDLERFGAANEHSRAEYRKRLGIGDRFVAAYVGAFGGWYLTKETADVFGALRANDPGTFALVLTQSDPEMVRPLLLERGYTENDFFIGKVPAKEIPHHLSAADAAVSLIKPCYSKFASSPTKNAEYLAAGLPILVNDGIGDSTRMTLEDGVGVVIDDFGAATLDAAATELTLLAVTDREAIKDRCQASARTRFDLGSIGGSRYRRLYEALAKA